MKKRNFFVLVALVGVCFALISNSYEKSRYHPGIRSSVAEDKGSALDESISIGNRLALSLTSPVALLFNQGSQLLGRSWGSYVALWNVREERDRLLGRVRGLEAENSRLIELESENASLRKLLKAGTSKEHTYMVANVVARTPSQWNNSFLLDKGSLQGVARGMPVIFGQNVVGQITVVASDSSKVMLAIDNASSLGALVQRSRVPAMAEGSMTGGLVLRFVERRYEVFPGDRVVTSGLDGVFPRGYILGVVSEVNSEAGALFHAIKVKPSLDFNRLEVVQIVLDKKPIKTKWVESLS